MRDYLNIGSSPPDEDCVQFGTDDHQRLAREECARYIALLRQVCGPEPEGARLSVKGFQHDAGPQGMDIDTYFEVVCWYDEGFPQSTDYAFHLESHGPMRWDGTGGEKWVPTPPSPAPEAHETGEECHCPSCERRDREAAEAAEPMNSGKEIADEAHAEATQPQESRPSISGDSDGYSH